LTEVQNVFENTFGFVFIKNIIRFLLYNQNSSYWNGNEWFYW